MIVDIRRQQLALRIDVATHAGAQQRSGASTGGATLVVVGKQACVQPERLKEQQYQ